MFKKMSVALLGSACSVLAGANSASAFDNTVPNDPPAVLYAPQVPPAPVRVASNSNMEESIRRNLMIWPKTTELAEQVGVSVRTLQSATLAICGMMETLRLELEETLNEATRRAYAQLGRPGPADG